ncbi:MAG TPA: histidine kinase [Verrucomicrobiae bacterium]|jgi:signal transduction histidine kinase|nr:histidine kinase [Verrucomicrobiae bacterium]
MVNSSLIQYRALLARQQLLQQQQHKRLARRIHDDVCQQLTLLSLQLSLALSDAKSQARWSQHCQQWSTMIMELGQNMRHILNELQPRILDDLGLAAALQWYARSSPAGVHCELQLPEAPVVLPPMAANELFAICRDIVNEIFGSNGVTEATLTVEQTDELVRLELRAAPQNPELGPLISKALDALSIHERLFCLDGSLETQQEPAQGLAITLSIPVSRETVSHAA